MRLMFGPVRNAVADVHDPSWRCLREVDADFAGLVTFQLSMSLAFALAVTWLVATPAADFGLDPWTMIVACAVLVPLHEAAHAAAFPRASNPPSASTTIEVRPTRLVLRASYSGAGSRAQYLWMLAMPLIVLSLAPIGACAYLGSAPREIVLFSLANGLASGGDVLTAILVLTQVPRGASMRMWGDRPMWKAGPLAAPASGATRSVGS